MSEDRLLTDWFVGATSEEDKTKFEQAILNSGRDRTWKHLVTLINRKMSALDRTEVSQDNYDTGSWAYKQAHLNGNKEAYKYLLALLSFVDTRTTTSENS